MNCDVAHRLIDFARPGATELDAAEITALETHLAGCPDCAAQVRTEHRGDSLVARRMQDVAPLPGARDRLMQRLAAARATWWRRCALKSALAVSVLVAGYVAFPATRLDPEQIVADAREQMGNQAAAEQWLNSYDRHFHFPPRFNPRFLVGFEHREYHGVTAPVLTFVRDGALARVVVLTPNQFRNLSKLESGRVAEESSASLMMIRDAEFPGVVYLVELRNGPVEPFYQADSPLT